MPTNTQQCLPTPSNAYQHPAMPTNTQQCLLTLHKNSCTNANRYTHLGYALSPCPVFRSTVPIYFDNDVKHVVSNVCTTTIAGGSRAKAACLISLSEDLVAVFMLKKTSYVFISVE